MTALTHREQQVCDKMVIGWTAREIAMSLGISHRTVEEYRSGVLTKYCVRNAVELTRAVYRIEAAER